MDYLEAYGVTMKLCCAGRKCAPVQHRTAPGSMPVQELTLPFFGEWGVCGEGRFSDSFGSPSSNVPVDAHAHGKACSLVQWCCDDSSSVLGSLVVTPTYQPRGPFEVAPLARSSLETRSQLSRSPSLPFGFAGVRSELSGFARSSPGFGARSVLARRSSGVRHALTRAGVRRATMSTPTAAAQSRS